MAGNVGLRVANVIFRFLQLCSAVIVVGVIGWAMHRVNVAGGPDNGRFIYAEVVGTLSIVASLALFPPLEYVFGAWPADLGLLV